MCLLRSETYRADAHQAVQNGICGHLSLLSAHCRFPPAARRKPGFALSLISVRCRGRTGGLVRPAHLVVNALGQLLDLLGFLHHVERENIRVGFVDVSLEFDRES
jgi:hypothetical protein